MFAGLGAHTSKPYGRCDNVKIIGKNENDGQGVHQTVVSVASKAGVQISEADDSLFAILSLGCV